MRKSQISASMMCSNLVDLQATIDVFEKEKVEYLHIDVMDGEFVPNFGLGVDYIRGLRELTSIPLDLHLMIKDPERMHLKTGYSKCCSLSTLYSALKKYLCLFVKRRRP